MLISKLRKALEFAENEMKTKPCYADLDEF